MQRGEKHSVLDIHISSVLKEYIRCLEGKMISIKTNERVLIDLLS